MSGQQILTDLRSYIREMPVKNRCDLSRLFADAEAFERLIERLAEPFAEDRVSHVAGIDAIGFALAGAVAVKLSAGFVPIRKGAKSAWTARAQSFRDYTGVEKSLELVTDVLDYRCKVLIVDDWSESGAQLVAAADLCRAAGAVVVGAAVLNADAAARRATTEMGIERLHAVIAY